MLDLDSYSSNLPDDFVKENEGVPGQVGLGQVTPDAPEKSAQAAAAEEVKSPKKAAPKKKGRK